MLACPSPLVLSYWISYWISIKICNTQCFHAIVKEYVPSIPAVHMQYATVKRICTKCSCSSHTTCISQENMYQVFLQFTYNMQQSREYVPNIPAVHIQYTIIKRIYTKYSQGSEQQYIHCLFINIVLIVAAKRVGQIKWILHQWTRLKLCTIVQYVVTLRHCLHNK